MALERVYGAYTYIYIYTRYLVTIEYAIWPEFYGC